VAITGAARMAVTVPADITAIRLVSPSGRVAGDRRLLGARIASVSINGAALPMGDLRFGTGFHGVEMHEAQAMRWTDGAATIFLGRGAADRIVAIDVACMVEAIVEQQAA
jgi:hypothetical protein